MRCATPSIVTSISPSPAALPNADVGIPNGMPMPLLFIPRVRLRTASSGVTVPDPVESLHAPSTIMATARPVMRRRRDFIFMTAINS
jgi:hypothetical protein